MYCISAFCFLLTKKNKGRNHITVTLDNQLDNLPTCTPILIYTTKRDNEYEKFLYL